LYKSIQKRLLVYILSITTIFLIAISAVNYYWAHQQVSNLSQEKVAAMADAANARVEGYLLQKGQNAWTLAQNEQIHEFVKKVSSQSVDLENDPDYKEMMTSFQRIASINQDIIFVYVGVAKTDRLYGNIEFTYPPGYSVSVRPWYTAAADKETLVYTAPYICPLTGRYVVTASAPFYDQQGNLLGVAAVDILVDRLQEIIEDIHIGNNGYAFMLDDQGIPIAAAQSQYYKKYIKDMDKSIPEIGHIKTKMLAREKGITISSYQSEKSFIIYTPVSKVGWSIGVVVPAKEVMQPIYGLGKFSFITVLLGMIVITLLIVMLTSRITKPINEFTGLMKRAEDGDFTVRAEIESQDEIGRLGSSLNHMLEKQQNLIRQVIIMANKMSAAGYELAVTMGETRTTLPAATNELSMLMDKSFWEREIDSGILGKTPGNQAFLEKLIACDHQCRFILIQAEISQQSTLELGDLNQVSDYVAAITVMKNNTELLMSNLKELSDLTSTLLVDYTEIYNYIKSAGQDLHDVKNTLSTVNRQISSIADIQTDATQRAINTAGEVVKYAHTLLNLTSSFHIQTADDDSSDFVADNADTFGDEV
jgi:HAMP domain-containing protein